MLTKRLFHQWSFILILCVIPLVMPLVNLAMNEDSGVFSVALYSEDKGEKATDVINSLKNKDSVIKFCEVNSAEEAEKAVVSQKTDAAWIINDDFEKNLAEHVDGKTTGGVVKIIEREETISSKISREILFGAIYDEMSYAIYREFSLDKIVKDRVIEENELRGYYSNQQEFGDVIVSKKLNANKTAEGKVNYLTAPLRGIMSLLILFCAIAAAIYHLKDRADGKYDWMPRKGRIIPAFASCLSASCVASVAVLVALLLSDVSTGFINEITAMLIYTVSVTGFSLLLCTVFASPGKLGAILPGIMILSLGLSPIFFELTGLRMVSLLLPTHYYLYSVYDARYYLYALVYCVGVYSLAVILNYVFSKYKENKKII